MIDKNKIAKAARKCLAAFRKANPDGYSSSIIDIESNCLKNFKDGAKWAINEFLKDLWHPASEKPLLRNGKCLVVYNGGTIGIFKISFVYEMLSNYGQDGMGWKYWAYVSDLFPKEGGNHD